MQQMVRACVAIGRRRALGAAVGASSRGLRKAGVRIGLAIAPVRPTRGPIAAKTALLEPSQRHMLEFGSCVALGAIGLGIQLGDWPVWTVPAGIGVYLGWVVLYAEITVQAKRRPALFQHWRWHGRRRSRGRPRLDAASPATPQPAKEQRPT
jgi:type IV secretory pathway TrbD component